ncbi:hypothetical protein BJX70DRAFT_378400, partial [Aspergillus crustosus]
MSLPSRRVVGPLDRRRTLTRCTYCAKRRIKCEGRVPCKQCDQRKLVCESQQQSSTVPVFVQDALFRESTGATGSKVAVTATKQYPTPGPTNAIATDQHTFFLGQFVVFIKKNTLTVSFPLILPDLLALLPTSAVMHHAAAALGALEAAKLSLRTQSGQIALRIAAVKSYRTALSTLQSCLTDANVAERDDILWTTIFLGLFELLSDHSGEGWIKHMLYGTTKLLQLAGPTMAMSPLRRGFFDLYRVLEASRALIYCEETILSQGCWVDHQTKLSSSHGSWEPMEAILTLMIQTSAFSLRSRAAVESIPESDRATDPLIALIAAEGFTLQAALHNWHTEALLHLSQSLTETDDYFSLALLYHHALSIFLSGNYDYFSYWDRIAAPVLSSEEVSSHVLAIIDISEQLIARAQLPGVMLVFPFTVAGARARLPGHRAKLLALIEGVIDKGFLVANRVKDDLVVRWMAWDHSVSTV